MLNFSLILSRTSDIPHLKNGFIFNSFSNVVGKEGSFDDINLSTFLYSSSSCLLFGSTSLANFKLERVYSCPQYIFVFLGSLDSLFKA